MQVAEQKAASRHDERYCNTFPGFSVIGWWDAQLISGSDRSGLVLVAQPLLTLASAAS